MWATCPHGQLARRTRYAVFFKHTLTYSGKMCINLFSDQIQPAQRQTDLRLYVMPYLPLLKALGILYTLPHHNNSPSEPWTHHSSLISNASSRSHPNTSGPSLWALYRTYLHTYSHTGPTAKYKYEANQKMHFRFTSLIPIQPYPNPAENQAVQFLHTHTHTQPQQASQAQPYPSIRRPSPAQLH